MGFPYSGMFYKHVLVDASGKPALDKILALARLTALCPANVITGTPIHRASQVVVPPPTAPTGSSAMSSRL